jgi:hypothetical protein
MSASSDDDATSNEWRKKIAAGMTQNEDDYIFERPGNLPYQHLDKVYKLEKHNDYKFVLYEYQKVYQSHGCGRNAAEWYTLEWIEIGSYGSVEGFLAEYGTPPPGVG